MHNYVDIRVNFIVPSCALYKMEYIRGKWYYTYRFKIPKGAELNGLYIYGHILQLKLVSKVSKNSINIQIKGEKDLVYLLKLQAEADKEFRDDWKKLHPDYYKKCKYIEIENKEQLVKEKFNLIELVEKDKAKSKFVYASNKFKKDKGDE